MRHFTGTATLLRINARRDRVLVSVWILVMAGMAYASAAATASLFSTAADQVKLATEINGQAALRALYGPIFDVHSAGELAMSKMTVLYALISTIVYVVTIRRHTRVEEESGRAELIGATVLGRHAPLSAAVVEALGVATGLAVAVGAASIAGGLPVGGSVWFAATWWGTGLVGIGTAAICCQVSASARTCGATAATMLGGAFVVRALGDGGNASWHWLTWLSPLGWNTHFHAWSGPRVWIVTLYIACAAVLLVGAVTLRSRRDLGGGIVAARPGRTNGPAWVSGAFGTQLRLHRSALIMWNVAFAGLGVAFGAMAPGLDDLVRESVGMKDVIDALGGAMIAAILGILAMIVAAFGAIVIGHAAADEADGRTEMALATALSRARWFGATTTVSVGGSVLVLVVGGIGLAVGYALAGGDEPWTSLEASAAWAPAVALTVGMMTAVWGWRRTWAPVAWAILGVVVVLNLVGELLDLPGWALHLSPYAWVPTYPIEPWSWPAFAGLIGVAVLAGAAGWAGFRRRTIG